MNIVSNISSKTNISPKQIETVLSLLTEGASIPFIARYRKDHTGGLDEVQISQIQELDKEIKAFEERKIYIIKSITDQDKMTDELMLKINQALTLQQLEDLYLPYKPKRKTKAQTAREHGLEPLAEQLMLQEDFDIDTVAAGYINENVLDTAAALQGARDIIAEDINEDADIRAMVRRLFEQTAQVKAQVIEGKEDEGSKYKDYFDYRESVKKIPSHRMLAIMRGFMEQILRMNIEPEEEEALTLLSEHIVKANNTTTPHLNRAIRDSYRRLMHPSLESELRQQLKARADDSAIHTFAENLRQLLLSSPLGNKPIIAIDPGYRTGCKVVVLDEKGDLLHTTIIFVHEQNHKLTEAEHIIRSLISKYDIKAIAVGDGTAGRETEQFIDNLKVNIPVFMVNEDGASIYSASEVAREEFPQEDITVRGAVSIGRRLMDPLAELVKIEPKNLGVGQYQHDVNQVKLKEKLDQTVSSCVNAVGVNINTAGKHLLSYISGIGPSLAENIVNYRKEKGMFTSRKELLSVPRLGAKAYEQCAGFTKVIGGEEPLDNSTVHPESYHIVRQMAQAQQLAVHELIGNERAIANINPKDFITDTIGMLTIKDIIAELKKPGLDPRSEATKMEFAAIYKLEDVLPGMIVPGVITNITQFGAFVDIGVKQDGLVHISEITNRYIADPNEVLKLNQRVQVKVLTVDMARSRIALSIKQTMEQQEQHSKDRKQPKPKPTNKTTNTWTSQLDALKSKFSN